MAKTLLGRPAWLALLGLMYLLLAASVYLPKPPPPARPHPDAPQQEELRQTTGLPAQQPPPPGDRPAAKVDATSGLVVRLARTCESHCARLLNEVILPERKASYWNHFYPHMSKLLRDKNLTCDVFVEIGTAWGGLASYMLNNHPEIKKYIAIDPFLGGYDDYDSQSKLYVRMLANYSRGDPLLFSSVFAQAMTFDLGTRQGFGERYQLVRDFSGQAARYFKPHSVDCVFVDGLHTYEGVSSDARNYRPILKPGGYMVFHDYMTYQFEGVDRAVKEFALKLNNQTIGRTRYGGAYLVSDGVAEEYDEEEEAEEKTRREKAKK